jgi:formate/nitrite transporter FocA (FNT family)
LVRRFPALWWSGVAAGLSIGFSVVAKAILAAHLPDAPRTPVIDSLSYSVGFLIVILGCQPLFTENTLTAVLPAMQRGKLVWWIILLRLWMIVLSANVVGCAIFAGFHILHGCSWDRRAQRCDRHIRADDAETTDAEVPRWDYGRLADCRARVDAAFIGGQRIHRHHLDDLPDRCR